MRTLCRDVYGDDGVTHNTCTLRYAIGADRATRAPLTLHGRPLARAFGRDTGANLADGVVVLEGGFTSGGSVKNWTTVSKGGTVVLVRDFPRDAAKELVLTDDRFSIEPEVDLTDLREERDRLVARLAEIDSILN